MDYRSEISKKDLFKIGFYFGLGFFCSLFLIAFVLQFIALLLTSVLA